LADHVLGENGERTVVWITHEPVGLDRVDTVVQLDPPPREVRSA
jgi:ABC-type transport system involved in cytochrome bd biosynthesis fused ATPase/permease subunit